MADILIKNTLIHDGTGKSPFKADILVSGSKIEAIGTLDRILAETVIEGEGLASAPGFIDTHTHSDGVLLNNPQH